MSIHFTGDNHWFHLNVIRYCARPFKSLSEMHEVMFNNWNHCVESTDMVYHLGDFAMGSAFRASEILQSLHGRKILIKGNHDKGSHEKYLKMGFAEVHDQLELTLGGITFLLNHYPYTNEDVRFQKRKPIDTGLPLLCGHVHEKWRMSGKMLNVGVDCNNFAPVHESVVIQWAQHLSALDNVPNSMAE